MKVTENGYGFGVSLWEVEVVVTTIDGATKAYAKIIAWAAANHPTWIADGETLRPLWDRGVRLVVDFSSTTEGI